jgi:hypothetical protein
VNIAGSPPCCGTPQSMEPGSCDPGSTVLNLLRLLSGT